jgi:hypothetical protein
MADNTNIVLSSASALVRTTSSPRFSAVDAHGSTGRWGSEMKPGLDEWADCGTTRLEVISGFSIDAYQPGPMPDGEVQTLSER